MSGDHTGHPPVVLDVAAAARLLGVSPRGVYGAISDGTWPTPVLRVGRLIRIPTAPLLAVLGVKDAA